MGIYLIPCILWHLKIEHLLSLNIHVLQDIDKGKEACSTRSESAARIMEEFRPEGSSVIILTDGAVCGGSGSCAAFSSRLQKLRRFDWRHVQWLV